MSMKNASVEVENIKLQLHSIGVSNASSCELFLSSTTKTKAYIIKLCIIKKKN